MHASRTKRLVLLGGLMQPCSVRHSRLSRIALHLTAVTALAGGCVLVTGAPGHAAGAARPDSYGGEATASSLHFQADRNPQPTPVTDPFHVELPFATSALSSSGTATATASPFYPGQGLLGVPALLCQASPMCPPFPDYPLMTTASYPTTPDAQAQSSPGVQQLGPLTVSPNLTVAHAQSDRVEARATAAGAAVEGVLSVDAATTRSQQAFEGSTLVVTAEATVKGLDLGAGALHIDSIRSVAVARVDGGSVTSSTATTTVTGATAGGTPVSIDSTGVHVADNGDDGALAGGANAALAQLGAAGIDVRLLTPTRAVQGGAASAMTGGLLVSFERAVDVPPAPGGAPVNPNGTYVGSVTVAGAGVTAFAAPAFDLGLPPVDVSVVPVAPPTGPQPGGVNASAPITAGLPDGAGVVVPPGGLAIAATVAQTRRVALLGVPLEDSRVRLMALLLLGYPALVLLSDPLLRGRPRPKRT